MSGGVGPTYSDISLPNEGIQGHGNSPKPANPSKTRYLSLTQLNCLAVMIIVAASGMVTPEDLAFVLFSIFYMYLLLKVAFPPNVPSKDSMVFDPKNKILRMYVTAGAIIGLFLPVAYIFHGILEGDSRGIKAAAPHVFLLGSQVFMEGVAFSDRFSIPVRVYVPVFYNTRRIFTLVEWMRSEFWKVGEEYAISGNRVYVGRVLALANMAFWCFNLFGFLLPVYLPKAFKMYYSESKVKD
ncbi:PSI-INTERACTING ROOT-CELL ENRICHED 3 [Hibiscus trionum]|uniref:PSI-INTERACTING ROOT-CELL ENRICHED 3 n=1 Tax=Hibiscus trionum TaxID=183268 RepID=A0A9W7H711_HIBTR|nr:PSI-INTERACTING ROOT-CELL ENRICHED 3 [Hibiscus trionum]